MAACRYCGRHIEWDRSGGRWVPLGRDGQRHQCPPGTRRTVVVGALATLPFPSFTVRPGQGRVKAQLDRGFGGSRASASPATQEPPERAPRPRISNDEVLQVLRGIAAGPVSEPTRLSDVAKDWHPRPMPPLPAVPVVRTQVHAPLGPLDPTPEPTVEEPAETPVGRCSICGRTASPVVLAKPHRTRTKAQLAAIAEERGGLWRSAMCVPSRRVLLRLLDEDAADSEHRHSMKCGVPTTKTTYRVSSAVATGRGVS